MREERLYIEKITFGGVGLGRLKNGKIVFVPYVIPGEKIKAIVTEDYKDYAYGEISEIIEAAPSRINPPCSYYGICGGCHFQHLPYEEEIKIKEEILRELFYRQGKVSEIPLKGTVPSPKCYAYRNNLRLHVEASPLKMGFVKRKSHEVLKIEKCLIADPLINEFLKELYRSLAWISLTPYSKRAKIELSPLDHKVTFLFWILIEPKKEDLENLTKLKFLKSVFYHLKGSRPRGPFPENTPFSGRKLFPSLKDLTYYIQPGVFTQSNWEINLLLMKKIIELSEGVEKILDLHTGMGNFLLPLVKTYCSAKEFLGVDTDIRAIEDAIYTTEKNDLTNKVDFRKISATEILYECIREGKKFDLILLDPPRGGCKELIRLTPNVAKNKIIYISCDASTLVRDIVLFENKGFLLKELYLFDMFPRTYHFEVLALLERKG